MCKPIQEIKGVIPNTNCRIEIPVKGKNIIVTGPNGSGKTSFLKSIHTKLEYLIKDRALADLPENIRVLGMAKSQLVSIPPNTTSYENQLNFIKDLERKIEKAESGINLSIENPVDLIQLTAQRVSVISFFAANRAATISHADKALGIESEQERVKLNKRSEEKLGSSLEQHLVNLKNRRSLAITEENNALLAKKIEDWMDHFEINLKELMEDQSTELSFNPGTLKFKIKQDNKPEYTFQNLSSGYLAIFDIYADLLMQSEYFTIPPNELTGVVVIDEIDAHLHVSLQRLILPFFAKSFPKVQFIVSTHSPFVLTSVKGAIIYDLGRNQAIEDDLYFYPYSSVMEGLLSTKTTSVILDNKINELANTISSPHPDKRKLEEILQQLEPFGETLDPKSKAFYLQGINTLMDEE